MRLTEHFRVVVGADKEFSGRLAGFEGTTQNARFLDDKEPLLIPMSPVLEADQPFYLVVCRR
jgi:hypothetical protein